MRGWESPSRQRLPNCGGIVRCGGTRGTLTSRTPEHLPLLPGGRNSLNRLLLVEIYKEPAHENQVRHAIRVERRHAGTWVRSLQWGEKKRGRSPASMCPDLHWLVIMALLCREADCWWCSCRTGWCKRRSCSRTGSPRPCGCWGRSRGRRIAKSRAGSRTWCLRCTH